MNYVQLRQILDSQIITVSLRSLGLSAWQSAQRWGDIIGMRDSEAIEGELDLRVTNYIWKRCQYCKDVHAAQTA
jgi:hypothetical protein